MRRSDILNADAEARRFLMRVKPALDAIKAEIEPGPGGDYTYRPHAEVAALKRASLDLTRALAKMRKP